MKKKILIPALLFIICSFTAEAEFNISVNLKLSNSLSRDTLCYFGVNSNATDLVDMSLGEGNFPPTPGVLDKSVRAFMNMDTTAVPGIWTYKDYRAVPEDQDVFFKQYKYMTFWGIDNKVTVYWGKLPKAIKSAWFEDNINSALVRVNMLEKESVELTNPAIDEYFIKVIYDKSASSVVENDVFAEALISPNPATDYINIKNDNVDSFEIFNSMGDIVMAKESSKNVIISSLPAGSYFIKIHLSNGKILTDKFIKH